MICPKHRQGLEREKHNSNTKPCRFERQKHNSNKKKIQLDLFDNVIREKWHLVGFYTLENLQEYNKIHNPDLWYFDVETIPPDKDTDQTQKTDNDHADVCRYLYYPNREFLLPKCLCCDYNIRKKRMFDHMLCLHCCLHCCLNCCMEFCIKYNDYHDDCKYCSLINKIDN